MPFTNVNDVLVKMNNIDEGSLLEFAERLKAERKRLGHSQETFAAIVGINRASQGNYERGSKLPTVDYLFSIASLGVDLGYLFNGLHSVEMAMKSLPTNMLVEAFEILDKLVLNLDKPVSSHGRARLFAVILRSFSAGRQSPLELGEMLKVIHEES